MTPTLSDDAAKFGERWLSINLDEKSSYSTKALGHLLGRALLDAFEAGALDRARATAEPTATMSALLTALCSKWSAHHMVWAGDVVDFVHSFPYATVGATVAPSPAPDSQESLLRAMARNYGDGPHQWDKLDRIACERAASGASPEPTAEVTEQMVTAYLEANDAYWERIDALPSVNPSKWRNGTPQEATRVSLIAALAVGTEIPQKHSADPVASGGTPSGAAIPERPCGISRVADDPKTQRMLFDRVHVMTDPIVEFGNSDEDWVGASGGRCGLVAWSCAIEGQHDHDSGNKRPRCEKWCGNKQTCIASFDVAKEAKDRAMSEVMHLGRVCFENRENAQEEQQGFRVSCEWDDLSDFWKRCYAFAAQSVVDAALSHPPSRRQAGVSASGATADPPQQILQREKDDQCECEKPLDDDTGHCLDCSRWINYHEIDPT